MTSVPQRERLREATRLQRRPAVSHAGFLAGEAFLAALVALLAFLVKKHPGPLPGEVSLERDVQHALLPHHLLTDGVEALSALNWPLPAAFTLAVIAALFLLLRRWLDVAVAVLTAALVTETSSRLSFFIHRPRPSDHGIHVLSVIKSSYSFPSGHVVYATAVFGLFLFLTSQVRRPVHPALLWAIRLLAASAILLMPVSRVLEGEHWPSDTLGGVLFGGFWLIAMSHLYVWARHHWPWSLAPDER